MPPHKKVDPAEVRAAVLAIRAWLTDDDAPEPSRPEIAAAVRTTARTLAQVAPGNSVEVRVPPFVAVQCIEGPRHTRGTPPNVVETTPRTWLLLATGLLDFDLAVAEGLLDVSGHRAGDIVDWLPIVPLSS
ncbi:MULTISPECIES: sterol carrier family protein [unclassified Gordonia (in: high G+C Gram-positive bacteria)]|uniref:sterol carrier family protein n=1 Tax=unclassified Gordonia (in: high G+C Gram-positive bacteria) TaxID=2657482 RepID=UPI001F0DFE91|nr:sterol carrier family protein [Gordonia sp. ABSL49_1]MCH5645293.1 sterol carrier family protein [Gordonia sp. ABSL49_1]